jgi:pre-rRNA-processing protein IPI3
MQAVVLAVFLVLYVTVFVMEEIILVTCGKEDEGMVAIDLSHGSSCISYKNCVAEGGALCVVQSDFIICSQAQKPCINIWRWGKVQAQFQCHIQEIVTSLATDSSGTYLVSGTKRGWLYCWELSTGELINSLQAHFKSVTRVAVTKCGNYCVSVSEDGNGRVFELCKIVDSSSSSSASYYR